MGKCYDAIDSKICKWIKNQHMFFVGTAPLSESGSVSLSPKGHDTLRVVDAHTLAFLDFGGSGIETIAHLRENRRIVIMMCAFEGPPNIFRFHGHGEVVTPLDDEFESLAQLFDRSQLGVRSIIRVLVTRISDSCGYGVPFYEYKGQRPSAANYIRSKGVEAVRESLGRKNLQSLDGLPGISDGEAKAYTPPTNAGGSGQTT